MKNTRSSVGVIEDMLCGLMHDVATENHLRIKLNYLNREMRLKSEAGEDVSDLNEDFYNTQTSLELTTELRRSRMRLIQDTVGETDDKMWCTIKHQSLSLQTAFEQWQDNFEDYGRYEFYLKAQELYTRCVSAWLGFEVQECAACLSDMLKDKSLSE